ncbi:hypothetical protein UFOVP116_366 [uncultured Caudovirales phage]|uniref:Uncharacterized protein n=1 Tax=uncultured Caudovirales phage TaxID=2100421 RepID=A0A6J5LAF1_9CAUD|nr:hypothetical protein UFOVP116_366 [uncultured Caudovirales phage]
MRFIEIIREGGWDTTLTQGTVLRPSTVASALKVIDAFVRDFNAFLSNRDLGPIERGRPTGSSAYFAQDQIDNPDKVYGDIDLQMVAPEVEGASYAQFVSFWNKQAHEFVSSGGAPYVDQSESKPGHPIVNIGDNDYVQVDFMWHPERLRDWGASRVTPERNIKGLLTGNMYSVLGELLNMSIQHAGVQLKVQGASRVSFSKQKDTKLVTVTTNPRTWILDIFDYEVEQNGLDSSEVTLDAALSSNPGTNIDAVKISSLAAGIKGLAASFEKSGMFGQGTLVGFSSASDFLDKFLARYTEKAMVDVQGTKRDKATTPEAQERAKQDREKILSGLNTVTQYFH